MTITKQLRAFACLAIAAMLLTGCAASEKREPARIDQDIPSGGAALEVWATRVAKDNGIRMDYSVSSVARETCKLIPKSKDLFDVVVEVSRFRKIGILEAGDLLAISIYGYCPQYKSSWESHDSFKDTDVKGVTPIILK